MRKSEKFWSRIRQAINEKFNQSKNLSEELWEEIPKGTALLRDSPSNRIYSETSYAGAILLPNAKELRYGSGKDFLEGIKDFYLNKSQTQFYCLNLSEHNAELSKEIDDFISETLGKKNNRTLSFYQKRAVLSEKMNESLHFRVHIPNNSMLIWENGFFNEYIQFDNWESVEKYLEYIDWIENPTFPVSLTEQDIQTIAKSVNINV